MGESTGPQMDFNSLSVMEESKKPTVSASGVTGMAMDPWWWLEEGEGVHMLITGLE